MSETHLTDAIRAQVHQRAGYRCEYCHIPHHALEIAAQVDHIIPRKHHGPSTLENLASSCADCNAAKGTNLASLISPDEPLNLIPLFHPRLHNWDMHFEIKRDGSIIGKTPTGQVTIDVLNMNNYKRRALRAELIELNLWDSSTKFE